MQSKLFSNERNNYETTTENLYLHILTGDDAEKSPVKSDDAYRWMVFEWKRHTLLSGKAENSSDKEMRHAPLKQEAEVFAASICRPTNASIRGDPERQRRIGPSLM